MGFLRSRAVLGKPELPRISAIGGNSENIHSPRVLLLVTQLGHLLAPCRKLYTRPLRVRYRTDTMTCPKAEMGSETTQIALPLRRCSVSEL